MNNLKAFYTLAGRDAFFWLGALGLGCVSIVLLSINQPHAPTAAHIDIFILAAFAYPALAGWLAGALIQELQSCTFTWVLPGVQDKISRGFFTFGAVATLIVVPLVALQGAPYNPLVLGALGLAGYCLGSVYVNLGTKRGAGIAYLMTVGVLFTSKGLGDLARSHPWATALATLAVAAWFSYRLLRVSTFRRGPFRLTTPLPGAFFLQRSQRFERQKQAQRTSTLSGWRPDYLGEDPWKWVRAGAYEAFGPLGFRIVGKAINSTWVLWLLVGMHAWIEKGDDAFGVAFGKTLYDVLFRSPHVPAYGQDGPYAMLVIVIAALGGVLCLKAPLAPDSGYLYPLSRRSLAQVSFRGAQAGATLLFVTTGLVCVVVGLVTGYLVGYETELDFFPFFLRPLMATTVLLPLLQYGRLRLRTSDLRKSENTYLYLSFGIVGFVVLVGLYTYLAPLVFTSPWDEFAISLILLVTSRFIYRVQLDRYFTNADLA